MTMKTIIKYVTLQKVEEREKKEETIHSTAYKDFLRSSGWKSTNQLAVTEETGSELIC